MFGRLLMMIVVRRVVRMMGERHGDVASAAIGAALASRKTRALGFGGAAALTMYELVRNRRAQRRMPAPRLREDVCSSRRLGLSSPR